MAPAVSMPIPTRDVQTSLSPEASSVPVARAFVSAALALWGLDRLVDTLTTVTSELVTNSVCHPKAAAGRPRTDIGLSLVHAPQLGLVVVAVTDEDPAPPTILDPDAFAEHGHGMRIVAALTVSWGWAPSGDGKIVWSLIRDAA